MFRLSIMGLALAIVLPGFANAQTGRPSLDLRLEGPRNLTVGTERIKITGPFVKAVDGKGGLAVGNASGVLRIPAHAVAGETGTILFTFMNKPIKPANELLCRCLLTLRGEGRQRVCFYQAGNEVLYFAFKNYNEPQAFGTTKPLEFNRWYHAACTWDGTTVKFFVDGVQQAEFRQPYTPTFPAGSSFFYFGPFIDGATNPEPWHEDNCLIRELKVYKRALAPTEIMAAAGVKAVDASEQFPSILAVPRVAAGPTMDGKLDDGAWSRAASFISLIDGQQPGESFPYKDNNPRFCHDGRTLYVGFRTVFPGTYKLAKGEPRSEKEPEVWGDDSFEFYVDTGDKVYRFAGNAAGGYAESMNSDVTFNGRWTYRTTVAVQIDNSMDWQGEIAIPFETLGISSPVGRNLKVNFCRTWRGMDRIGITSLAGMGNYDKKDRFATLRIRGEGTAFQQVSVSNPNYGTLEQQLRVYSQKGTRLAYTATLLSSGGFAPVRELLNQSITPKTGAVEPLDCRATIDSTTYDRLLFQVKDAANAEVLMQQVVPFKVVEDYLDVVPVLSAAKVYMRPRYTLVKGKTGGNPVRLEVVSSADKTLSTVAVSSDDEFAVPFARENKSGTYRAVLYAMIDGKKTVLSSQSFHYDGIGPWEKRVPEERVLPPFTPLVVKGDEGKIDIGMWGRVYRYTGSGLPTTVTSTTAIKPWLKETVLTGASLSIDGSPVSSSLKITKSVPYRVELVGGVKSDRYDLEQNSWIEYDGLLWNKINVKAHARLSGLRLRLAIPGSVAKFYHATGSGFGLGGRRTAAIDKGVALPFWPIVWVGDEEHGICWFAETNATWKTSDSTPIRIIKDKDAAFLEVTFADTLKKGQDITVEFGLIATPVKPLPEKYPFTMFGDMFPVYLNRKTPRAPVTAAALLPEALGEGFYDLPLDGSKPNPEVQRVWDGIETCKKNNAVFIPYEMAVCLPDSYPIVKDHLLEWQVSPANHLTYQEVRTGRSGVLYNLCPASEAADYYIYSFKKMVEKFNLEGVYFDFGVAVTCSNGYHGCTGGYHLLAKREFYKRIAGVLADANQGRYTIVIHNSESVQIPAFTFVTHFLNGEGLRQASSAVFHFGKDLLDHYAIPDFAAEHSSLTWGVTSSIYVPTDPLAPQFGGEKEGWPGPEELYKFRMTKAAMAGALVHGTIPSDSRGHYGWFDKVTRFYDDFGVSRAEFLPYWRNGDYVRVVRGKGVYVSLYRRPDKKEILAVISHVSKEHLDQDVVVEIVPDKLGFKKVVSARELLTGPDPQYENLYTDVPDIKGYADASRWRIPVKLGDFGVEFNGLANNRVTLRLKHHSVALVKIVGE